MRCALCTLVDVILYLTNFDADPFSIHLGSQLSASSAVSFSNTSSSLDLAAAVAGSAAVTATGGH